MPAPIRILHIITSVSSPGGIEESLRLLFQRVDRRQYVLGLCTIQDETDAVPQHFKDGAASLYCGARAGRLIDFFTTLWVARSIRDFRADIVHTHTNKGCCHGRLAGRPRRGTHVVSSFYDMSDVRFARTPGLAESIRHQDVHEDATPGFLAATVYPLLNVYGNQFCDAVTACSDRVRSVYTADSSNDRFRTIYLAYDDETFAFRATTFSPGNATLGVVGRLVRQKGLIYLLEAMLEVRDKLPGVRLRITGDGPLRQDLMAFVAAHDLASQVEFQGAILDKRLLHDCTDIYVQPSISEGYPLAVQEAMGCGLPVIASALDGIRRMITDGDSGILVPPKDPAELATAICGLATDPARAAELGKHAYQTAKARFSSNAFVGRIERLYSDLAAGARSP